MGYVIIIVGLVIIVILMVSLLNKTPVENE